MPTIPRASSRWHVVADEIEAPPSLLQRLQTEGMRLARLARLVPPIPPSALPSLLSPELVNEARKQHEALMSRLPAGFVDRVREQSETLKRVLNDPRRRERADGLGEICRRIDMLEKKDPEAAAAFNNMSLDALWAIRSYLKLPSYRKAGRPRGSGPLAGMFDRFRAMTADGLRPTRAAKLLRRKHGVAGDSKNAADALVRAEKKKR